VEPRQRDTKSHQSDDRRTAVRYDSTELGTVLARVLGTCDARLIDISRRGVLFESEARLTIGAKVSIRITTTDTSIALKGIVVRSKLAVDGKSAVYQTALELEQDVSLIHQLEIQQRPPAADEVEFVATVPHDFGELQRRATSHDL
jgi:hypothetical protein